VKFVSIGCEGEEEKDGNNGERDVSWVEESAREKMAEKQYVLTPAQPPSGAVCAIDWIHSCMSAPIWYTGTGIEKSICMIHHTGDRSCTVSSKTTAGRTERRPRSGVCSVVVSSPPSCSPA
jgi:hypothetical protein